MKIIVIGLGKDYCLFKDIIPKMYEVIAVSDNFFCDTESEFDGKRYIPLSKLGTIDEEVDAYLICTRNYYWSVRESLIKKCFISEEKILDMFTINELEIALRRDTFNKRIKKYYTDIETYEDLYLKSEHSQIFKHKEENMWPLLYDYDTCGSYISNLYFWFEEWCSKRIYKKKPCKHYDIGGRIDGFISRLNTFGQAVTLIDVRKNDYNLENVDFVCANAVNLSGIDDESVESLSIMWTLDVMGLGKYGDPVDPDAWYKCLKSIERVMQVNGDLYIVVPVGKEMLEFNNRRVFMPQTIIKTLNCMELKEFAIVDPGDESGKFLYDGFNQEWIENNFKEEINQRNRQILGGFWFKKVKKVND